MARLAPSYSSSTTRNNIAGGQSPKQPSALYSTIMTPVNLTVFLVSLLIVELRYSLQRAESAAVRTDRGPWKWLPMWFRRLVLSLSQQPYGRSEKDEGRGRWYYHSKQEELMKMEADEAFQMQGAVLVALGVLAGVSIIVLYVVGSRVYYGIRHLMSVQ